MKSSIKRLGVILFVIVLLCLLPSTAFASGPVLITGLSDYEPGDTVTFNGSGFSWGETVNLTAVGSTNGSTINAQATADIFGNIGGSFKLPLVFEYTYALTATGTSSGSTSITFYDSANDVVFVSPVTSLDTGQSQVYTIRATTSTGQAYSGLWIEWTVSQGSGAFFSPTCNATGTDGRASSTLQIGSNTGNFTIHATGRNTNTCGGGQQGGANQNIAIVATPPVIAATVSPPPNAAGWNNSNVTIGWNVSDPESGIASSSGCSATTLATETTGTTLTCTATNGAGMSNSASVTVKIDKTASGISITSPTDGAMYMLNQSITANYSCSDTGGSGVATCAGPVTNGAKIDTSSAGSKSFTVNVTDVAGNNNSKTVSYSVTSDITPPVISYTLTPSLPDGTNGWYKSNVTLVWNVSDPESAVTKSGCVDQNITADQAAIAYSCTATSAGGTSGPISVAIKRDATPPSLTFGAASPAANANGWNNTNVSFSYTTADNLSGVSSSIPTSPLVLSGEGSSVAGSVIVIDNAGNSATFTSLAVKIDKTPPTISGTKSPGPNANGWNNTDVTVHFTCSDGLSGIPAGACPADQVLSTEGSAVASAAQTVTDAAGNTSAPSNVVTVKIDKTAPAGVSVTPDRAADSNGWYNHAFTATWNGTDATSGLASCTKTTYSGPDISPGSLSGTCTDNAGNTSAPVAFNFKYDATKPTITISGAADGTICSKPTPSFTASDNLSQIAASNGVLTAPNNLSGVGTYTYTVTATDYAGNTATASKSYFVAYGAAFGGFLQPINSDGLSRFKLGSTVPVKFQLMCGATPIPNATAWLYVAQGDSVPDPGVDEAISTSAATIGNLFRYDNTAQQYIFNLSTKSGYTNPDGTTATFAQGTWSLKIKLDDGTWRSVNIQLPK